MVGCQYWDAVARENYSEVAHELWQGNEGDAPGLRWENEGAVRESLLESGGDGVKEEGGVCAPQQALQESLVRS